MFLDNTWRTWFDFGHRTDNVLEMGGPDGPIDYYVIAGPTTAEVVRRYTDLTGKAPLAPGWSLGYQQSRYSYMSADEVRRIADRLRAASPQGRFVPWWHAMDVTVHGWSGGAPVAIGRTSIDGRSDPDARTLAFSLPRRSSAMHVSISRR